MSIAHPARLHLDPVCSVGIIGLTCAAKISLTPPVELGEEPDQCDKVSDPEAGPSVRHDDEGIGTLDVGPASRQRPHAHVTGLAEEDPVLTPRVGVPDQVELLSAERVERMGHTKSLRTMPTDCS
jgi:hypothetical protein